MKPIHVVFLLVGRVLSAAESNAQRGWFWQNPLPQGNTLSDVGICHVNQWMGCWQ